MWAGSADDDPVSQTSNVTTWTQFAPVVGPLIANTYDDGHGISPHTPEFGANQYVVGTSRHSHYWEPHSEGLTNQARVLVGLYSSTGRVHGTPPPDVVQ